jgi:hypothetical protein
LGEAAGDEFETQPSLLAAQRRRIGPVNIGRRPTTLEAFILMLEMAEVEAKSATRALWVHYDEGKATVICRLLITFGVFGGCRRGRYWRLEF